MAEFDLERLKPPATALAVCAALIVGFDLLILLLNALGYDVSIFNQATTSRRHGQAVRSAGLGLRGWQVVAANTVLLLGHSALFGLALKVRLAPSRGWALVTGVYSLLPCNFSFCCFPVSIWLLAATHSGQPRPGR